MFVNVLCTIKHFRMRKASRSVIILYCNAEAAGFEPANRLRAVNCFRGSLLHPLGHASCYPIGTLSQTLTLRAAFASSTYLLLQIPGPGRSSDDDLLILPSSYPPFQGGDQASVRTRAQVHRFAVLRPASEDALLNSTILFNPPFQGGTSGPAGFPSPHGFPARQLRPGI